jgi:transposase-like protein
LARMVAWSPDRMWRGTGRITMVRKGLRPDHQSRLDWWRGQIQRLRTGNLTVTELCRQLGVSLTAFCYWKRCLKEGPGTAFGRIGAEPPSRPPTTAAAPFVPVSIVEPDLGIRPDRSPQHVLLTPAH